MKIIAFPVALLFAVSVMQAESPAPAALVKSDDLNVAEAKPADPKTIPAQPGDPKAAPAAPVDPKAAKTPAKKEVKKVEKEPVLPGVVISRPNGTFLALEVVNSNFKLSFYDKKKKPMAPDVSRANAVWPNPRARFDNRTVLNPSGTALVGTKPALPPYNFIVRLTLLKGEGDSAVAVENYTVQYH